MNTLNNSHTPTKETKSVILRFDMNPMWLNAEEERRRREECRSLGSDRNGREEERW